MKPQINSYNQFKPALLLSLFFAACLGLMILLVGKNESFLLINGYNNYFGDFFFKYFTHIADIWMWAVLGIFCFYFKRKYLIAVFAGIIISIILAQFFKRVVFPEELRPITFISENFPIHLIEGVKMKTLHSFPSGHSTTAFTIALILAHMINKMSWSIILPILALIAAYSRVYLAQHFPTDILAGICLGILSALLSLMIFRSLLKTLSKKSIPEPKET